MSFALCSINRMTDNSTYRERGKNVYGRCVCVSSVKTMVSKWPTLLWVSRMTALIFWSDSIGDYY